MEIQVDGPQLSFVLEAAKKQFPGKPLSEILVCGNLGEYLEIFPGKGTDCFKPPYWVEKEGQYKHVKFRLHTAFTKKLPSLDHLTEVAQKEFFNAPPSEIYIYLTLPRRQLDKGYGPRDVIALASKARII